MTMILLAILLVYKHPLSEAIQDKPQILGDDGKQYAANCFTWWHELDTTQHNASGEALRR